MLTGDNGLLTKSSKAVDDTVHASVLEGMRLEASTYVAEKYSGGTYSTLIEYLSSEDVKVIEATTEEGKWQIDVEKLLGSRQKYGNGSNKNDVYMLEAEGTTTGSIQNTKVATLDTIKVASTSGDTLIYNVVYYAKPDNSIFVGTIADTQRVEVVDESSKLLNYFQNSDWDWRDDGNHYYTTTTDDGENVTRLDIGGIEDDDHHIYEYILYKNQMYKLTYTYDEANYENIVTNVTLVKDTNVNINKPGKFQVEGIAVLVTADQRVHNRYCENGVDEIPSHFLWDYTYTDKNSEEKEAKYWTWDYSDCYRWYDNSGMFVRVSYPH